MRRNSRSALGIFLAFTLFAGCGDPVVPIDEALEPFIGTWDAEVILVTSDADTTQVADLMENGSFAINVQESGAYTATLTFGGIPLTEFGQISVGNGVITLRPDSGQPATSTYVFVSANYVEVEGPTEFDFNLDGMLDPAVIYMEWRKR